MSKLVDAIKRMFSKRYRTIEQKRLAIKRMNDTYARLFSTEDGQAVLDFMIQMELTGSIANQGDNLLDIGVKQGRANLVKDIMTRIQKSKEQGDIDE
jgi:hypothetical protein